MLRRLPPINVSSDARGSIVGLCREGDWEEINWIQSDKGVRGRHYHKQTREMFIVLSGRIRVEVQTVDKHGNLRGPIETHKVKKGDVFIIDPWINHTFTILTRATWLNLLSSSIDPASPDFQRPVS